MNNWFKNRKLRVLKYQTETLAKIKTSINKQEITILAACPSSGKTIMAIYCIEDYLRNYPNHKVLILSHGTTILRSQFNEVLDEVYANIKPGFKYNLVEKFSEYNENAEINICLPQTLNGNILNKIDLLVVDEAHQFYFADMVQNIIKQTRPSKQLLLTGTPSVFIEKGFPIISVPLMVIYDEGMVSDVGIEIACSNYYNFDIIKDFNEDKELKNEIKIKNSETKKTLDDLLEKIMVRLNESKINNWESALKSMKKTMFACRSQQQAIQIKLYFDNIGINSALSISDTDSNSSEIQRFKTENNCLILIVVGRGILGFNYPKLVNIVDLTLSQNIDRIYQLFCRIVRKHPNGDKKLFFKIATKEKSDYYKYIMTGVLALSSEEFFTKFNGKNFDDMIIPAIKTENKKIKRNIRNYKVKINKSNYKDYKPIDFSNLPVFEFFKDVYNNDKIFNTYILTTIKDVRSEFLSRKPRGYWTIERCMVSAKNYSQVREWKIGDYEAYQASQYYNWFNDCIKHMTTDFRLMDMCIRNARGYKNISEWMKSQKDAYNIALKYDWFDMCTEHMIKQTA